MASMILASGAVTTLLLSMFLLATRADNDSNSTLRIGEIFAFADSLSDTGNLCIAAPLLCAAGFPPYGQNFSLSGGRPSGRFSNGRTILDCLAEGLHIPYLTPYLQTAGANFSRGANFASAGGTATYRGALAIPVPAARNPFVLQVQVNEFLRLRNMALEKPSSVLPPAKAFKDALYYIEIGGNDINYNNMAPNVTEDYIQTVVIPEIMDDISKGITRLFDSGARRFFLLGVPSMGCAPVYLATRGTNVSSDYNELGCLKKYDRIDGYYNRALNETVQGLRTTFPTATFVVADYFSANIDIIKGVVQNPFDKSTILSACCGGGGEYNCAQLPGIFGCRCGVPIPGAYTVCPDTSKYMNWDGIHFTDKFSTIVINEFLKGNYLSPAGTKLVGIDGVANTTLG